MPTLNLYRLSGKIVTIIVAKVTIPIVVVFLVVDSIQEFDNEMIMVEALSQAVEGQILELG